MNTDRDRTDPDFFDAFLRAPHIQVTFEDQCRQNRDMQRASRRYLYPVVRTLSNWLLSFILIIKRLFPNVGSEFLLNRLGVWFIRNMLSKEAAIYFIQHFHIESNLINFVAKNCNAEDVLAVELYPATIHDLGELNGVNAIKQHDVNIYNLMLDLGYSKTANTTITVAPDQLDFSMLVLRDIDVEPDHRRLMNLDMDTGLYIMGVFMALFFTDKEITRAVTSLQFDESLMTTIANITGDDQFRFWTPMRFTNWIGYSNDLIRDLRWHMFVHEYAHNRLKWLYARSVTLLNSAET